MVQLIIMVIPAQLTSDMSNTVVHWIGLASLLVRCVVHVSRVKELKLSLL